MLNAVNQIYYFRHHVKLFIASIKKTKGVFIPPVVTPRRSPRQAAHNILEQVTPARETLTKFILTRGDSNESKAFFNALLNTPNHFHFIHTYLLRNCLAIHCKHFSNDSLQVKLLVNFQQNPFAID